MPGKYLSVKERELIINLHVKQSKSNAEIAKIVSRSRFTIQSIIGRFKYEGRVESKSKSGWPSVLADGDRLKIKRMVTADPFISTQNITTELHQFSQ